jgi:putative oxidoreductase
MNAWQRYASLAARLALAAIFIHSGFGKLAGPEGAAGYIASKGLPAPMLLAILAGLVELGGGLLLAVGLGTRWAALGLALFLVPTTLLFHNPLGLAAAQAQMQQVQLFKNIAIFGGLLAVVTGGAPGLSIDALLGRRRQSEESPQPLRRAA